MEDKITRELQTQMRKSPGPHKVSIRPKSSNRLDELVSVNRYEGMSPERLGFIRQEIENLFAPICSSLESYGLVLEKTYVPNNILRNISALLNKDQITELANQDYVGEISLNLQKNLPF